MPQDVTQAAFMEKLDQGGFADMYDFAYMPQSFNESEGKGYVFVNFISPAVAGAFVGAWHKRRPWGGSSSKSLVLSAANLQGLEANAKKWGGTRMNRIRNAAFRP
eukprot:CAMPEP_0198564902 /NCGR_PEP_ID=MMETSP1462-20131121/100967_1 /TAXON_ID=1333877 /ORGANISM="Brandtodinium nutriculum, Strain RCC3387" /LENGTH=104 /DNA_ID=CAMNT_0044295883 /DNA_START=1 /DNA_END=311 /DNA_ORIENTATION=+